MEVVLALPFAIMPNFPLEGSATFIQYAVVAAASTYVLTNILSIKLWHILMWIWIQLGYFAVDAYDKACFRLAEAVKIVFDAFAFRLNIWIWWDAQAGPDPPTGQGSTPPSPLLATPPGPARPQGESEPNTPRTPQSSQPPHAPQSPQTPMRPMGERMPGAFNGEIPQTPRTPSGVNLAGFHRPDWFGRMATLLQYIAMVGAVVYIIYGGLTLLLWNGYAWLVRSLRPVHARPAQTKRRPGQGQQHHPAGAADPTSSNAKSDNFALGQSSAGVGTSKSQSNTTSRTFTVPSPIIPPSNVNPIGSCNQAFLLMGVKRLHRHRMLNRQLRQLQALPPISGAADQD